MKEILEAAGAKVVNVKAGSAESVIEQMLGGILTGMFADTEEQQKLAKRLISMAAQVEVGFLHKDASAESIAFVLGWCTKLLERYNVDEKTAALWVGRGAASKTCFDRSVAVTMAMNQAQKAMEPFGGAE